jgi:hypothetical protein
MFVNSDWKARQSLLVPGRGGLVNGKPVSMAIVSPPRLVFTHEQAAVTRRAHHARHGQCD